jgi:hypothetical protein
VGSQGTQGVQGRQGTQGLAGTGTQGTQGVQGTAGPIAGSDTQLIFNNAGSPAGTIGLTYSHATGILTGTTASINYLQVSPSSENYYDSLNPLKFAGNRDRVVVTKRYSDSPAGHNSIIVVSDGSGDIDFNQIITPGVYVIDPQADALAFTQNLSQNYCGSGINSDCTPDQIALYDLDGDNRVDGRDLGIAQGRYASTDVINHPGYIAVPDSFTVWSLENTWFNNSIGATNDNKPARVIHQLAYKLQQNQTGATYAGFTATYEKYVRQGVKYKDQFTGVEGITLIWSSWTQDASGSGGEGTQGIQGVQGSQGIQGIQGVEGSQGTQGIQGVVGSQGTQGTQGVVGSQGTQGIQGRQGTQGTQGVVGSQGTQGTQGVVGSQGSQGVQGRQGTQGTQGVVGSQGTQGTQGVVGSQGSQGVQGVVGSQGSQGVQGRQGTQGTQGVAGSGSQGTQGVQGVQGIAGSGSQGTQGVQGRQGTQGLAGTGSQGTQGVQGIPGTASGQGTQGVQGIQGTQGLAGSGSQGTQGVQGRQGTQGVVGSGSQGTQGTQGIQGRQGTQGVAGSGSQGLQGIQGTAGGGGGTTQIPDLRPLGVTGDIIVSKGGGWTTAPANTVSMPVPNFASILSNIGGVTSWSVWSSDGVGPPINTSNLTLPRVLGDGTFLVMNQLLRQDALVSEGFVINAIPLYEMNIRQGVGFTYPSGTVNHSDQNGNVTNYKWSNYMNKSTPYLHQGWAIKLSGVTSGGASGLGGSGLGGL